MNIKDLKDFIVNIFINISDFNFKATYLYKIYCSAGSSAKKFYEKALNEGDSNGNNYIGIPYMINIIINSKYFSL